MERYQQLLREGVTDPVVLAHRIGVTERSVHRYGNRLAGGRDRRVIRYHEHKPRILAHLQAWPNSRLSAWDLYKLLGVNATTKSASSIKNALRALYQEGLIQGVVEPRDPSTPNQFVTRWQIAQDQEQAE